MTLYNHISKFGSNFNSIRKHEDFIVIDLKIPIDWEDQKIITSRGGKVQIKSGNKSNTHKLVSFFNIFSEDDCNVLVSEIEAVIKWNRDVEEKNSLLELKMIELRKLFSENEVGSLRKLNFDFENKTNLDEKKPGNMVPSGSLEGPEGNPTT
tara:strand:+ start:1694 stop:2149 length:456 start_codon:yes stop_codon:yes gene_type:complete